MIELTVKRKVRNKKALAIILGIIIVFTSTLFTKSTETNNSISVNKIEYTTNQKVIGIKTNNKYQGQRLTVNATAYYNDPITYTGTVPKVGRTIAVDPDVIPLGSKVYIPHFNKVFIAEDTGSAIKGNKIDIYMNTYNECMSWGIRQIDIIILD